jgi:hypothetical protein
MVGQLFPATLLTRIVTLQMQTRRSEEQGAQQPSPGIKTCYMCNIRQNS